MCMKGKYMLRSGNNVVLTGRLKRAQDQKQREKKK